MPAQAKGKLFGHLYQTLSSAIMSYPLTVTIGLKLGEFDLTAIRSNDAQRSAERRSSSRKSGAA
jgi:hypothetical protein